MSKMKVWSEQWVLFGALLCLLFQGNLRAGQADSIIVLTQTERTDLPPVEEPLPQRICHYRSPLPLWLRMPLVNAPLSSHSRYLTLGSLAPQKAYNMPHRESYRSDVVEDFLCGTRIDRLNMERFSVRNPGLLRVSAADLEASRIISEVVDPDKPELEGIVSGVDVAHLPDSPQGVELKRRYWKPGWESIVQFSENYVSPNWHKGGNSALNLYNKQLFRMDYNKERISWLNELDWRLSVFTSAADTVSRFRVAEDLLRLRSNFGVRAVENLFYTLDVEARTQLFTMREENKTERLSALFSPVAVSMGLGMKYVLDKKYPSRYGRRLRLDINLAPLAYDFRWSMRTDIDMKRHGFGEGKRIYSAFGSMLKAEMIFDITSFLSWRSYLYYNTSYHRVETEWENGLNYAFSRFFSARVNVQLRFDDAAPRTKEMYSRLQINQLLSIGFAMTL